MSIFNWKEGSRISLDPQAIGDRIEQLEAQTGQRLTPEDIVQDASKVSSPMHSYFNWDDTEAAHQYRLDQARHLIRALVVVFDGPKEPREIKAFVSIVNSENKRSYVPMIRAMSDRETREQVLAMAWRELESFEKKYAELKELAAIFQAINRSKKKKKSA